MNYNEIIKKKNNLKGYDEQEILIDMFSSRISEIANMRSGTMGLFVKQGLGDALDKRKTSFKKIKFISKEEKSRFINEIIINTIKRAKLITSVDKILPECNKIYDKWKIQFRPDEI